VCNIAKRSAPEVLPSGSSAGDQRRNATEAKRARALLRRINVGHTQRVSVTDKKNFYLNSSTNNQNNRVWTGGPKKNIGPCRLLVKREKCARHVMVSVGVRFGGNWPSFHPEGQSQCRIFLWKVIAIAC
jgi:hypothetical protein